MTPYIDRVLKELIETLAAIEHERWSDWQKYVHGMCIEMKVVAPESNDMTYQAMAFPKKLYDRWERQINTPYDRLTEKEKQSDRDQVMRYLPFLRTALENQSKEIAEALNNIKMKERYMTKDGMEVEGYNLALLDAQKVVREVGGLGK